MAMMISSEAPQSGLANLMAMKGRYGDTELVHMSRPEVQGLASLGKITINPDTGLPEAFKLGGIFKTLIPMAATAVGGFFGGPMGAAAGNALGQFAMGERDIGKIALQSMLTYGMGAMSASSGTAAAGATGSSTATTAGNATRAGMVGDGLNAGYNASQASLGSVSQVAPYVSPSSFGDGAIYSQSAGSPSGFNAYLSSDAIPYNPPSAVASALQAPTPQANLYNFEGSPGFAGTPFGKIEGGTNLTAAQTAKQGVTTIKTPDGNYISASDMKMDPTDYAKAHFSRPSTLIGGGLSAISNGVFEEEQPEYKENERIPYKPKNLKLISDPNTGKHRYIEITDEEAQQSRFAAEGGLIGLDNGGYVSRVNTFLNPERVQNTDPLGESLDGLQSLSSDMNIGSTSLLKPMAPMQPSTLDINTDKTAVNNGGLTLEEFGNGQHRYIRNDPLVETIIEANDPSSVQGVPDDISDDDSADAGADAGGGGAAGDPGGEGGGEDGSEGAAWATGGLVGLTKSERKNVRHLADGGTISPEMGEDYTTGLQSLEQPETDPAIDYFNKYVKPAEFDTNKYKNKKYFDKGNYKVYKDIKGKLTIGPGVLIDKSFKKKLKIGDEISKDVVDSIAYERWQNALTGASDLSGSSEDIYPLAEMVYQMGKNGVSKFKDTLKKLKAKDYEGAAEEAMNSEWAEQTPKRARDVTQRLSNLGSSSYDEPIRKATGGGIGGYFEGQVDGRGNGMSDEIPFEVEGNDPDKALLSRDEYVIPADAVAMLGNGSSNGGAERLDGFIKQLREQSFGTQEQQQPIERQQGLSGLA
jgi:lysozyme